MPPKRTTELSLEDVEFLQAVRYVENNPDQFGEETDVAGPSTGELRQVLETMWDTGGDWSKGMISYRMSGPNRADGGRGWDTESGFGLVKLHEATLTDEGWTSRRVELTDKGRKRLAQMEKRMDVTRSPDEGEGVAEIDSSVTDVELQVEKLQSRVETLESEKEELEDLVRDLAGDMDTIMEAQTGALDNEVADRLREVFNRVMRQRRVNQMVFDMDTDPFDPEEVPTEEDVRRSRASVRKSIVSDEDVDATPQSGENPEN